jgi:hypothetical protein
MNHPSLFDLLIMYDMTKKKFIEIVEDAEENP